MQLKNGFKFQSIFILLIAESCSWMLLLEFEIVCANVKINSCSVVRYMNTVSGFQYHFPYLTRTTILMIIIWVKSDDRFIVVWPQHARRHIFQTGAAQYGPIWPQICSWIVPHFNQVHHDTIALPQTVAHCSNQFKFVHKQGIWIPLIMW